MGEAFEPFRTAIARRLEGRRQEVQEAVWGRLQSLHDEERDGVYPFAHGLRTAVTVAIDYALEALRRPEDKAPPTPPVLLDEARLAAREGVSLEAILRRYVAGYGVFGDYLIQEAEKEDLLRTGFLQRLLAGQLRLLDRLLSAVSEEHQRELHNRRGSTAERRLELVRRLLGGEVSHAPDLGYDVDEQHHLGLVALGDGALEVIGETAKHEDWRLLAVRRDEEKIWAWFGSRRGFRSSELTDLLRREWPPRVSLALGEPGKGLGGWRTSHRQACAAFPIAVRGRRPAVRYAEVAVLSSIVRDDLLVASLRSLCLAPFAGIGDGGAVARETLRGYFDAERNVSSAAAALGVSRRTVSNRLRTIEERLEVPVNSIEVEIALRLEELEEREEQTVSSLRTKTVRAFPHRNGEAAASGRSSKE